jgi:hypothetical protein
MLSARTENYHQLQRWQDCWKCSWMKAKGMGALVCSVLWHVDPLLGKGSEISKYTTVVTE